MIIRKLAKIKELPAGHEDKKSPGCLKKIIFDVNDFPKGLSPQMINWARIPKGRSFKLHYHQDMTEIFIILKGQAKMRLNNKHFQLKEGDAVMVPAKSPHSVRNDGHSDFIYYVVGLSSKKGGKTITLE